MTYDPRQAGSDLAGLWSSMAEDDPPSPQLWAEALAALPRWADGTAASAPVQPITSDGGTPPQVLLANAIRDYGQPASVEPSLGIGQVSPRGYAANPSSSNQTGAPSAQQLATPVGARVPNAYGGGARDAADAAAPDPTAPFLRPELSSGPDPLVPVLAAANPGRIPPGMMVDPNTGAASRWRFVPTGDPLQPMRPVLEPVGPGDKQGLLESLTGARANYPLGQASPQEQQARALQQAGPPSG